MRFTIPLGNYSIDSWTNKVIGSVRAEGVNYSALCKTAASPRPRVFTSVAIGLGAAEVIAPSPFLFTTAPNSTSSIILLAASSAGAEKIARQLATKSLDGIFFADTIYRLVTRFSAPSKFQIFVTYPPEVNSSAIPAENRTEWLQYDSIETGTVAYSRYSEAAGRSWRVYRSDDQASVDNTDDLITFVGNDGRYKVPYLWPVTISGNVYSNTPSVCVIDSAKMEQSMVSLLAYALTDGNADYTQDMDDKYLRG